MNQQEQEYVKGFWGEIEQAGKELRAQRLPELTEEAFFLFQRTGNRLVYENAYFGRRKFLTVFGILAEYGKRAEDIDKLSEVLEAVCDERFWALPAHVNFEHLDENTIDLFAAETAQTLAEMLVIFGDRLSAGLVERVKNEVLRRVMIPFCSSAFPYSGWETDRCNWSAVCAGSVGMAAIYMYRMGALRAEWKESCIKRVCAALQCYLDGMEEDGACTEGLGYYNYGMSYYTAFAELLEEETKGEISLLKQEKCRKIAAFQEKCYFSRGVSVSFSDGSSRERFLPGMTAYLVHCFPETGTPDYLAAHFLEDDACYRWLENERNIRWLIKYGGKETAGKAVTSCDLLPSAQWMLCKDATGNGYAAKGGHNAESHNHNDVGHFLCVYDGELFLTDLGAGEYTREYFGAGRYDILCNRSRGHSVPLINDCEQCAGREYGAEEFAWDAAAKELRISFAGAYPKGYIDALTRRIRMENVPEELQLQVTDTFVASGQTKRITENLITPYEPVVTGAGVLWLAASGEDGVGAGRADLPKDQQLAPKAGAVCQLILSQRLSGDEWQDVEQLCIMPVEHSLHDGRKTTVYLIQWEVPVSTKKASESRIKIRIKERGLL